MAFEFKMFINGQWTDSEKKVEVRNPYNNETLGEMPIADEALVDQAIQSAYEAKPLMAALPAHQRSAILEKTATLILAHQDEMTRRIVLESGKTWKWAAGEVKRAAENLKFAAEEAKQIHGQTVPMEASAGSENRIGFWMRFPVGVVGAIPPFNFPLNLVVHKVAPAIAAGNTVVLKPASTTPGPSQLLVKFLLEAGLPPQALNLVYGGGATVGEAIVKDERINKITFTGSPLVGRRIEQISGLKKVTLELGSNSATVVDESADMDLAVERTVMGAFANVGQVCISVQRIYVHEKIAEKFIKRFVAETKNLTIGDPLDPQTDIGPMINENEARRVERWVNEALQAGAEILTGGKRTGSVFEPTVLKRIKRDMNVVKNEIFGPVVGIVPYSDFSKALDMVNDSRFGLQAGVFTKDIDHAFQAVKTINTGGVIINDVPTYRVDHMPYGGNKESGIGREGAKFAIEEMTNIKMVVFNL